ncbi:Rieske (2Fe-2S) protein [Nocardioides sp. MJB4]|uniref:Cytochrome bc1 complex Rieske iron-sulfur subunit n=1 Tax=Nocardioides donggukensis TaxID=2774019 RepID=A0A927K2Z4_9ACTN|nr:Rieske 2Fe-2S domain-containing protein [Nocardioides donggukensis]MBD8869134.1 Rieske (2Fe-2S) protein [Nocardioides donggukensis]
MERHLPRPTDVDEAAAKRAERQVATFFVISMISAVLFCVAYFSFEVGESPDTFGRIGASNLTLGLSLGLALLCIGIGVIQWARKLMADVELSEPRHPVASSPEDRSETLAALSQGLEESGLARRPLIRNTLLGSLAMLGLPAIVALRDLGPLPDIKNTLEKTFWTPGARIVNDVTGRPLRPSDLEIGGLVNAEPEGLVEPYDGEREGIEYLEGVELLAEKGKAAVIVVRMEPEDVTEETSNWGVEGIVCYSKICTHVGCPISLWEQQTHHLLCPCHQSTFDLADKGRVVFGPAARALPQLPIEVGPDGYLVAVSDFREPVGPSYWERG